MLTPVLFAPPILFSPHTIRHTRVPIVPNFTVNFFSTIEKSMKFSIKFWFISWKVSENFGQVILLSQSRHIANPHLKQSGVILQFACNRLRLMNQQVDLLAVTRILSNSNFNFWTFSFNSSWRVSWYNDTGLVGLRDDDDKS